MELGNLQKPLQRPKQEKEPHRELQGASGWTWRAHRSPGRSGNSDI